jgi:hypothetical protein
VRDVHRKYEVKKEINKTKEARRMQSGKELGKNREARRERESR